MKNKSFIFFASYYEAINELPEEEQGKIYQAIVTYAITKKIPKHLTPIGKACFKLLRPLIDNSITRYQTNLENGKKGGRPPKIKTETKPNKNPNETQSITETNTKPKQNLNRNRYRNSNNNINIKQDKTKQVNRIEEKNINSNDVVSSSLDKKQYFLEILNKKLVSNNLIEVKTSERLKNIFIEISKQETFNIKQQELDTVTILENLVNLFVGADNEVLERIDKIFATIDQSKDISNKLKYTISTLFQQSKQVLTEN